MPVTQSVKRNSDNDTMKNTDTQISQLDLRVTDRCVSRCAHCAGSFSPDGENTLSVEVAGRFLDAFAKRWVLPDCWSLSGGEPMLFPERVYELATLGRERGIAPRLSTNGFWAESKDSARSVVRRLAEENFSHVWISTDSFHAEFVPERSAHVLIEALKESGMAFFVNFNYLFPVGEEMGGLGLPQVRLEVERDSQTLRIHQKIARTVGDGGHGWCRAMDLGRGRALLDSLGSVAKEARRVLDRYRDASERPKVLELSAGGDVIHRCNVIGNVDGARFPEFLDHLS